MRLPAPIVGSSTPPAGAHVEPQRAGSEGLMTAFWLCQHLGSTGSHFQEGEVSLGFPLESRSLSKNTISQNSLNIIWLSRNELLRSPQDKGKVTGINKQGFPAEGFLPCLRKKRHPDPPAWLMAA